MTTGAQHYIGKNGEYLLSSRAISHIVDGDYVVRPTVDAHGNRILQKVIKGGLHTLAAWQKFLEGEPGYVHLMDFEPKLHKSWYYARELQNGVLTLRIPRELFSGSAADITMLPDTLYKSGYLWKTLFPRDFKKEDVLRVITEALLNIDIEESEIGTEQSLIIGYAQLDSPFTAMRIRIQLQGNEIRSAFPTWDQPDTGNNGKPYSHEHSISFPMAASTIGVTLQTMRASRLFQRTGGFEFAELIALTPEFLQVRTKPTYGEIQDSWHETRRVAIDDYIRTCEDQGLLEIECYVGDFALCKEPAFMQTKIYEHEIASIVEEPRRSNVASVMQNLCDCFYALYCADKLNGTLRFLEAVKRFLSMAVVHTGWLNTLEYKRLTKLMLNCSLLHHHRDSFKIFVDALCASPIRSALYSEFNLCPFVKTNDEVGLCTIGMDGVELAFTIEHFYEFAALMLGENYLFHFARDQRLQLAAAFTSWPNSETLIKDAVAYFKGDDFDFFANTLIDLSDTIQDKTPPTEEALVSVVREYSRMLNTYRQRVVLEDLKAYKAKPDFEQWGTEEFFELMKQKHKRSFIAQKHQAALNGVLEFATKVAYLKLERRTRHLIATWSKEHIPLPRKIPDYLHSWRQDPRYMVSAPDAVAQLIEIHRT